MLQTERSRDAQKKGGVHMDIPLVGKGSSRRAVLKGAGAFSALAITGLATPAVAQSKDLNIISDIGLLLNSRKSPAPRL
jgi:hypothetical protein